MSKAADYPTKLVSIPVKRIPDEDGLISSFLIGSTSWSLFPAS
jgi:hypothetical protein